MPKRNIQPYLDSHLKGICEWGEVRAGRPLPWGMHQLGDGVNFSFFSRHATRLRLEFYDAPGDAIPSSVIDLEPARHRTGDVWHVWVRGVYHGQLYGYRVEGPYLPQAGHRYNPHKLLLDPFATAIAGLRRWDFGPARGYDPSSAPPDISFSTLDDGAAMPKCVFTGEHFDWEGDYPPRHAHQRHVSVRSAGWENEIHSGKLLNEAARKLQEDFEVMLKKQHDKLTAVLAGGSEERAKNFAEYIQHIQLNGQFWSFAAALYESAGTAMPCEDTIKEFVEDCPPFRAFVYAMALASYDRCFQQPGPAPMFSAGRNDMMMPAYLPYCDQFITPRRRKKGAQERCLREAAAAANV